MAILCAFIKFSHSLYDQDDLSLLNGSKVTIAGELEFVFQKPFGGPIKGVIFLAHGCSHQATDFWPRGPGCEDCIGLPAERSIVLSALKRGWVAVAASSSNRDHKCWTSSDLLPAGRVIKRIYRRMRLSFSSTADFGQAVPLYLLGASSGGRFVSSLGATALSSQGIAVRAVCVQIMSASAEAVAGGSHPPVVFVSMRRDEGTEARIESQMSLLRERGIPAAHLVCDPMRVTPSFFYDHYGLSTREESAALVRELTVQNFIDPKSEELLQDPRQSDWREAALESLPKSVPSSDSLVADASALSELMNLAWNMHEITDQFLDKVFDWFEARQSDFGQS